MLMIRSLRVPQLFLIVILLLPLHGLEQLLTGLDELYELQAAFAPFLNLFANRDLGIVLLIFIATIAVLLLCYGFMVGGAPRLVAASFFGVQFMYESHHIVKSIVRGVYFPGAITALPLVCAGALLLAAAWREFRAERPLPESGRAVPA
jgi:hypothetical protein